MAFKTIPIMPGVIEYFLRDVAIPPIPNPNSTKASQTSLSNNITVPHPWRKYPRTNNICPEGARIPNIKETISMTFGIIISFFYLYD